MGMNFWGQPISRNPLIWQSKPLYEELLMLPGLTESTMRFNEHFFSHCECWGGLYGCSDVGKPFCSYRSWLGIISWNINFLWSPGMSPPPRWKGFELFLPVCPACLSILYITLFCSLLTVFWCLDCGWFSQHQIICARNDFCWISLNHCTTKEEYMGAPSPAVSAPRCTPSWFGNISLQCGCCLI